MVKTTIIQKALYLQKLQGDSPIHALRRTFLHITICLLAAVSVSLFSGAVHSDQKSSQQQQVKILVLGDSLSAAYGIPQKKSWVNLLASSLDTTHPNTKIINASISGEPTGGGRSRLPGLLNRHNPQIVILELGGNDGLRGFPISVIHSNLDEMIKLSQQKGSEVLLLGMRIPPNYGTRYTEEFFNTYQRLANQYQLPFVPFLLENIALDKNLMQQDGIHPNAEAQPAIMEKVSKILMPVVKQFALAYK